MTITASIQQDNNYSQAADWFLTLRDQICREFENLEDMLSSGQHAHLPAGRFERKQWKRNSHDDTHDNGGGEMSIMRGRVFEKVGVNISTVYGKLSPDFAQKIPGADQDHSFWASGISLVAHMRSPKVPAVHMNTRHIVTQKSWFGGGADLTPMIYNEQDAVFFHQKFKESCDQFNPEYYPKYKKWCDEYFYIKHRNEARGIGGIFYDYLENNSQNEWDHNFAFTQSVGKTFLETYSQIVKNHMHTEWTKEEREAQLVKRGRYAEFNLLYDRGTAFGLQTGGNVEAILMSLPPEAKWP